MVPPPPPPPPMCFPFTNPSRNREVRFRTYSEESYASSQRSDNRSPTPPPPTRFLFMNRSRTREVRPPIVDTRSPPPPPPPLCFPFTNRSRTREPRPPIVDSRPPPPPPPPPPMCFPFTNRSRIREPRPPIIDSRPPPPPPPPMCFPFTNRSRTRELRPLILRTDSEESYASSQRSDSRSPTPPPPIRFPFMDRSRTHKARPRTVDSSCESLFAHHSEANLEHNFYVEALHDADRYVSASDVEDTIRQAIDTKLETAPLRLINTFTGCLCNREAQINAFMESMEYKEILYSSMTHGPLQMEPIKEAVAKYFSWVMLSHRWQRNEPLLHEIQDKVVHDMDPVGTTVKLQMFCKLARYAGYRWAWSDTCCIDQKNNVELQRSVNSMFVWYRHSALTIVYLSDVSPSSKFGTLANSTWNTRGWTVQEFLAPNVVLFYQADWTPYLNDRSPNHKQSVTIMQELADSTGIDARSLISFCPGMKGAREKLRWASMRVTTLQEDTAYSLFGIFGVHLPVIYGEMQHNALGRLLQEIVAQAGDITALDWVGKSSEFNSCLPASITSYKAPPCTLPSLSEDQVQMSASTLHNTAIMELALTLYTRLDSLSAPRFMNRRLQLPCVAFPITEVKRRRSHGQETCSTYYVKAAGLEDLLITTEAKLIQLSRARPTQQTFLLVRPWNRHDLGLPDFTNDKKTWSMPWSLLSDHLLEGFPQEYEPFDSDSRSRALRLIVRLGQPFAALLLAQQRGGEYKRIASDHNIIAQVKDMASVGNMMDVRTLEIL